MLETKCPCCGMSLRVVVEAVSALHVPKEQPRISKSEYASVRDAVGSMTADVVQKQQAKFHVHTDIGKFRQALYNAGFVEQAENGFFFNDKNVDSRRLKLWFAAPVIDASDDQKKKLEIALQDQFGDSLLSHGVYYQNRGWGQPQRRSYIIRLKL